MGKAVRSQITFLLYGIDFWLPIAILILVFAFLFTTLEDAGRKVLSFMLPEGLYHSGFGILFGIFIVYVSGILLKSTKIAKKMSGIPFIGLFFGAGKIMTVERLANMSPCVFLYSPTCLSYGRILSEETIKLRGETAGFTLLNVYFPNVPTMVTGSVFPVRKESVIKVGNSSKEIIDLLLYSFRSPADLKYLPWEGESQGDFEIRARAFGLNLPSRQL